MPFSDFFRPSDFPPPPSLACIVCVTTMRVNWWLSGQFWLRNSSNPRIPLGALPPDPWSPDTFLLFLTVPVASLSNVMFFFVCALRWSVPVCLQHNPHEWCESGGAGQAAWGGHWVSLQLDQERGTQRSKMPTHSFDWVIHHINLLQIQYGFGITCTVRAEIFAVVLFSRVKPSRKFPLQFMSIYSNDNISKIAKLTTRELPHLAKTAKITVRENNGVYSILHRP